VPTGGEIAIAGCAATEALDDRADRLHLEHDMAKLTRLKAQTTYLQPPIYFQQKKGVCRAHCTLWLKSNFDDDGKYLVKLAGETGFKGSKLIGTAFDSFRVLAPSDDSAEAVRLQDEMFAKSGGPKPSNAQRAAMSWGRILPGQVYGVTSAIGGLDKVSMPKTIAEYGTAYRSTLLTLSRGVSRDVAGGENPLFGGTYTHHAIATFCLPHVFALFDPVVGQFCVAPGNALTLLNEYWGDVTDECDSFKYKDDTLSFEHSGLGSGA
jgi:hypothetical protein